MLAPVRAMTSGRATPLTSVFLVATSTLSGSVPRAGCRARSPVTAPGFQSARQAHRHQPIFQRARPCRVPSRRPSRLSLACRAADREICLVSGPPSLVSLVSSISQRRRRGLLLRSERRSPATRLCVRASDSRRGFEAWAWAWIWARVWIAAGVWVVAWART